MSYILAPNKEMLTPLLTFCLRAHRFCLRAYLVLRGAYAGLRAPQFCLCHTLTRGPLLNMNTRVQNMAHMQSNSSTACLAFLAAPQCTNALKQHDGFHVLCWGIPSINDGLENLNKMKPTNPNAHTYVNGTDVKTHGYAVTHNTFLQ